MKIAAQHRRQRGAATLEAAFAIPIFLALVACVAFAGWLGVVQTIVSNGAVEGARFASIPSSPDLRIYPDDAAVASVVDAATPLLTPSGVRVVPAPGGRNAQLRVEVSYSVPNPVAVLLAPLRLVGVGDSIPTRIDVTSRAEVRRE